jgi:hypothetical protein
MRVALRGMAISTRENKDCSCYLQRLGMIEIKNKYGVVLLTVDADTLREADLSWANLREANLREADLREADLRGANLRRADLCGADLSWASLRGANLRGADLRGASLIGADLSGANLSRADLCGADLSCKQYVCQIHGSRHAVVAIDDDVRIGCHRKPLAEWLEAFEAVGRQNKYTDAEIAEYGGWLRQIAAVLAARRAVEVGIWIKNTF